MANHLTMALIDTILTLHQRRWSNRRIARELGIDRATVARHLQDQAAGAAAAPSTGHEAADTESKPANAPIGSLPLPPEAKPANAPIGSPPATAQPPGASEEPLSPPGRASDCEPWRDVIRAKLDRGLSAQRIFQDLHDEHGYAGSYYSVRRFVRRLEHKTPLPFRRLECGPGEEA